MPTALLLENEPLIAMDIELALQDAGFDVTSIMSSVEAGGWLESHSPDVAIVDIELRDGPCHLIVEMLAARGVPFLVHSADLPPMHEGTAFAKGTWLNKPTDSDEIARAAQVALQPRVSA